VKRFLVGALFLLLSSSPAFAVDGRDPVTIIKDVSTQLLEVLDSSRTEFNQNPELLTDVVREILLPIIDVEYSARLILGRSGRGVSPKQLRAFAEAMSDVLIHRYSKNLLEFGSNELLQVLPMKGTNSDKLTRVRTRVKLSQGGFVPVDFAFHNTDEGWRAFDVTVEGISYVITFRNQISPQVQEEGIEKVTAEILAGNIEFHE
jgi:phospholipid transport system substrate-binding protein